MVVEMTAYDGVVGQIHLVAVVGIAGRAVADFESGARRHAARHLLEHGERRAVADRPAVGGVVAAAGLRERDVRGGARAESCDPDDGNCFGRAPRWADKRLHGRGDERAVGGRRRRGGSVGHDVVRGQSGRGRFGHRHGHRYGESLRARVGVFIEARSGEVLDRHAFGGWARSFGGARRREASRDVHQKRALRAVWEIRLQSKIRVGGLREKHLRLPEATGAEDV